GNITEVTAKPESDLDKRYESQLYPFFYQKIMEQKGKVVPAQLVKEFITRVQTCDKLVELLVQKSGPSLSGVVQKALDTEYATELHAATRKKLVQIYESEREHLQPDSALERVPEEVKQSLSGLPLPPLPLPPVKEYDTSPLANYLFGYSASDLD